MARIPHPIGSRIGGRSSGLGAAYRIPIVSSPIGTERVQTLTATINHTPQHLVTHPKGGTLAPADNSVTAAYTAGTVERHGKYLCLAKTDDFSWHTCPWSRESHKPLRPSRMARPTQPTSPQPDLHVLAIEPRNRSEGGQNKARARIESRWGPGTRGEDVHRSVLNFFELNLQPEGRSSHRGLQTHAPATEKGPRRSRAYRPAPAE